MAAAGVLGPASVVVVVVFEEPEQQLSIRPSAGSSHFLLSRQEKVTSNCLGDRLHVTGTLFWSRSSRSRALRTTMSFRMQATMATLASFPRCRSCW
jgi:hypothetical protein